MKAIVAALVVAVICGWVVYSRTDLKKTGVVLDAAEADMKQVEADLTLEQSRPDLPDGQLNWVLMRAMFDGCGLTVTPAAADSAGANGTPLFYRGPAQAWHARVDGPAMTVLACGAAALERFPLVVNTFSVATDGGNARAVLTVSLLGKF